MREGPVLRLAIEVAVLAARSEPYLPALHDGLASLLEVETGIGLVSWRPGPNGQAGAVSVTVMGGTKLSPQQVAEAGQVAARHPTYQVLCSVGTARPVRTSDHVAIREFWSTDVWR